MALVDGPSMMGVLWAGILPFATAVAIAALGRFSPVWGGVGIVAGFLAAYWAVLGLPPLAATTVEHKIFYVALAGVLVGLALDFFRADFRIRNGVLLIWPTLIVVWLGWERLDDPSLGDGLRIVALWLAGMALFDRLDAWRYDGVVTPVLALVLAAGLFLLLLLILIALPMALLAGAVAAATAGYLAWNWPNKRFDFATTALFAVASPVLAVATAAALSI